MKWSLLKIMLKKQEKAAMPFFFINFAQNLCQSKI